MTLVPFFGFPIPQEWFYVGIPVFLFLVIGVPLLLYRYFHGQGLVPNIRGNGGGPQGTPLKQVMVAVNPVTEEGTIQLGKLLNATLGEESGQPKLTIVDPNILDAEDNPVSKDLSIKQTIPLPLIDENGMEIMLYGVWDKGEWESYSFGPLTQGGLRRWDPLMVDFSSMSFLYVGWDFLKRGGLSNLVASTTGKLMVGFAVGLPCFLFGLLFAAGLHIHFG